MKNLGIIDIGSNSIRLVLAEIRNGNYFRIIDDVKRTVRLGMDMTPDGRLNPVRMEMALNTLCEFKWLCESQGVSELIVVATEAVRKASNQTEFLRQVQSELGLNIRILSGAEEAYYDYFGVINSMDFSDGLIMDIGGASTELIWVERRIAKEAISLPFGAINLTNRFNLTEKMTAETEKELFACLMSQFKNVAWLEELRNCPLVGVGGTVRNIGKISRRKSNYPIDRSHNFEIDANEVFEIYDLVKDKTLEQRKKIKGLSKERSDMFLGAASVATALIKYCGLPQMLISGSGLREGLIYSTLQGQEPIEDVLDYSLRIVAQTLLINPSHARQVWKLAESLYSQLTPLPETSKQVINNQNGNPTDYQIDTQTNSQAISKRRAKILKTAAILNDAGKIINYYNYHQHTFYMILNLPINGLSHKELIMAAFTIMLSNNDKSDLAVFPYFRLLNDEEKIWVQRLGVILRLAECFDRTKNGTIQKIICEQKPDAWLIRLIDSSSDRSPVWERELARACETAFAKAFDRKLQVL